METEKEKAIAALQSTLSFLRHVQHEAPKLTESAMEQEASIEAVLEQYFGKVATG